MVYYYLNININYSGIFIKLIIKETGTDLVITDQEHLAF